uniref:Uncharacterized protein n=1 Tax=Moniliophthora roreri TaxID=221103 RepID=A0A0W0FCW6_MONRR
MSSGALKGKDAHLLAIVDTIAKELGFYLGLANIEHNEKGYAEDYDYGEDDEDVTMAEVAETSTKVAHLVNLEGQLVSEELDVEEEDDQDYEGYMGNGAGSLERFYRRSALVIWPKWTRIGKDRGDRRSQYALETLRCLQGPEPTEEESGLFDYLCCSAKYLPPSITVPKLFPAARQWRSVERWSKLSKSFVGSRLLAALPFEEVTQAISLFGFEGIKLGLKAMILHDPTNQDRFRFLAKLQSLTDEQRYDTLSCDISMFVSELKSDCLDKIGAPIMDDISLLTCETLSNGGARRLKDGLLPQLKNLASTDVLEAFVSHLQSIIGTQDSRQEEVIILREVVRDILAVLLDKLDFFKLYVAPTPRYSWRAPEPQGKPDVAMKFIKQCLDSDNMHLAADALERMMDVCGQLDEISRIRTKTVLLPLVPLLSQDLKSRSPRPDLPLSKLSETSVKCSLEILDSKGGRFSREDFSPIVNAAIIGDNATLLMSTVFPKVKSYPWNEASWKAVLEEVHAHRNDLILPEDSPYSVSTVITEMVHEYAREAVLTSINIYRTTSIPDVLQFSLTIGGPDCLAIVLNRLVEPTLKSQYVSGTLVPLIPELKRLSNANGIPLHSEPFASTLRKIMKGWIEKVMGPKPDDAAAQPLLAKLNRWTCGDAYCRQVRQFLTSKPDRMLCLDRIGAPS